MDPFYDICIRLQAVRRQAEVLRSPLVPALGVAAEVYPHQAGNVLRVLTDTQVRHLLADEVGLGKTVQALMILNALRYQRRSLQALVVAPDQLVTQWRDEIMTRAHSAPMGESGMLEGSQYIRLAWEAQLRREGPDGEPEFKLSDIDPSRYDVLVVDELHRLRADVQNRIVRVAPDFHHLLVLTATPAFQKPARHAQLFALLEPIRVASIMRDITQSEAGREAGLSERDDLSSWPEWAAQSVVEAVLVRDRKAAEEAGEVGPERAALTDGAYRRVIRTRRKDFPGVLPQRVHCPISVGPISSEADRQDLMWEYFTHLTDLSREIDPIRLAKRVVLSPPSLEQRVDFLRRFGHDRDGLLTRVKPLVHKSQGDSRADALIDILLSVWDERPQERVLVAAQDNLTVDYLFDLVQGRLPEVGPVGKRDPLQLVRVRQGMTTEAVEDLGDAKNKTFRSLEAFQRGEAQLLLAPEVAQAGLNLQCARVLVLYSVPWRPEEVEQWIGRLDRIGNSAIGGEAGNTVDIYTITQDGLVDQKVVQVLSAFNVFERGVNLDGDHLEEVAQMIEFAALKPDQMDWASLLEATQQMADEDAVQELHSPLQRLSPWDASRALEIHRDISSLPPLGPVLTASGSTSLTGHEGWDRALEPLISLLQAANEYNVRWNIDPEDRRRFRSLWYVFGDRGFYGGRHVESQVVFSFGADPSSDRHPRHAHCFITRRADLETPPRRHVNLTIGDEKTKRPRRFLNFGDALHDELIRGWIPASDRTLLADVTFFEASDFWSDFSPGLYLIDVAQLDPTCLIGEDVLVALLAQLDSEAADLTAQPVVKALESALEADRRWLSSILRGDLRSDIFRWIGNEWRVVDGRAASKLLNPLRRHDQRAPEGRDLALPDYIEDATKSELERLENRRKSHSREAWSHRIPTLASDLSIRIAILEAEAKDEAANLAAKVDDAISKWRTAQQGDNPGLITRAKNEVTRARERARVVAAASEARIEWLNRITRELTSVEPERKMSALIHVRRG